MLNSSWVRYYWMDQTQLWWRDMWAQGIKRLECLKRLSMKKRITWRKERNKDAGKFISWTHQIWQMHSWQTWIQFYNFIVSILVSFSKHWFFLVLFSRFKIFSSKWMRAFFLLKSKVIDFILLFDNVWQKTGWWTEISPLSIKHAKFQSVIKQHFHSQVHYLLRHKQKALAQ